METLHPNSSALGSCGILPFPTRHSAMGMRLPVIALCHGLALLLYWFMVSMSNLFFIVIPDTSIDPSIMDAQ